MKKRYRAQGQRVVYFPNHASIDYDEKGKGGGAFPKRKNSQFDPGFDISFVGSMPLDRKIFFYRLSKKMVNTDYFFGNNRCYFTSRKKVDFDVTNKAHVKSIYKNTKVNIAYGSVTDLPLDRCWGASDRIFDILCCGGFVLHDYRRHLDDLFSVDRSLYTFETFGECCGKTRMYLKSGNARAEVFNRLYDAVKERHTVKKRIGNFIRDAGL